MSFRVFTSTEMIGPNIRHEFEMKNGRTKRCNNTTKASLHRPHQKDSPSSSPNKLVPVTKKQTKKQTLSHFENQKKYSHEIPKHVFGFLSGGRPGCIFCYFIWVVCLHPRVRSLAKAWLIVPMKKLKTINPAGRFCRNWKANTGQRCSHGQLVLFGKQSKILFWFWSTGRYMSLSCHEHQFEPISALDVSVYIVFPSTRFWYG